MLERQLEPEVMDTDEEATTYDAMDHRGVNELFVADFLAVHGPSRGGVVLDVGVGTALIPLRLVGVDPKARVLGIDLAESMLRVGRQNVEAAGLSAQIDLARLDAKRTGLPSGSYEAVISNSIVHHIPEPSLVFAELARLVAEGGTLFVRDLARPDNEAQLAGLVEAYAGKESAHGQKLFRDSLLASLTLAEVQAIVEAVGYPASTVSLTSDRHWTWSARRSG